MIDSDFELLFPDEYINNIAERLSLYTKLNELKTQEELQKFETELIDRFGQMLLKNSFSGETSIRAENINLHNRAIFNDLVTGKVSTYPEKIRF